jgi:hypothetical protein
VLVVPNVVPIEPAPGRHIVSSLETVTVSLLRSLVENDGE